MIAINWMCIIIELIFMPISIVNYNNWIGVASFIVVIISIIFYMVMFFYFSIYKFNRRQIKKQK